MAVRAQPMIAVRDVEFSSAWYQRVFGLDSDHGGEEYERLVSAGELVLQLHLLTCGHHHGVIGDPSVMLGNGVAVWFEVDDLDEIVLRAEEAGASVETPLHWNPNAGHRELWLRDPDNFLVVAAERAGSGTPDSE